MLSYWGSHAKQKNKYDYLRKNITLIIPFCNLVKKKISRELDKFTASNVYIDDCKSIYSEIDIRVDLLMKKYSRYFTILDSIKFVIPSAK